MKRFAFLLILLLGAPLAAQETPASPEALPQAVASQEIFDAGNILKGKRLEHAFIIRNTGGAELVILSARPG